jgi:valyl-tRNA synthetase
VQADPALLSYVGTALAGVRRAKSDAKVGMKAVVTSVTLAGPAEALARIQAAEGDLFAAGRVENASYVEGGPLEVRDAELAPPPA